MALGRRMSHDRGCINGSQSLKAGRVPQETLHRDAIESADPSVPLIDNDNMTNVLLLLLLLSFGQFAISLLAVLATSIAATFIVLSVDVADVRWTFVVVEMLQFAVKCTLCDTCH